MERTVKFVLLCLIVFAGATGCASMRDPYMQSARLPNGDLVVQGGDVGPFGTDNSWAAHIPKKEQAEVYRLEWGKTTSRTEWEGCPDKRPNKNAKRVKRLEQDDNGFEDVVVTGNNNAPTMAFGSNRSTLNALPEAAASVGAAALTGPTRFNIQNSNDQSQGQIQKATAKSKSKSDARNYNNNRNDNYLNADQRTDVDNSASIRR